MANVYLETTFFSFLVSNRKDDGSTYRKRVSQAWWDTQRHFHNLYISAEVIKELSAAPDLEKTAALKVASPLPYLALDTAALEVAQLLVKEKVMPYPAQGDPVHLAVTIVNGIDYLLSWNIVHLANPNKVRHLNVICGRIRLIPPEIVTPDKLWEIPNDQSN